MYDSLNREKLDIIEAFAHEWVSLSSPKSILFLNRSDHPLFPIFNDEKTIIVHDSLLIDDELKIPLIFGNLTFGGNFRNLEINREKFNFKSNWCEIFESLLHLEKNGIGLFILESIAFSSQKGQSFRQVLHDNGFYINAYLNTPENILQPITSMTPVIVAISRQHKENIFVAELVDEIQAQRVAKSFFKSEFGNNLLTGMLLEAPNFEGFKKIKIDQQFLQLSKQYESYSKQNLGELAKSIKLGSRNINFEDLKNCIYIPKIGISPVVSSLQDLHIKQQNYYQVQLDESVENAYVAAFLNSKLGKLSLETAISFTFIPHLNKSSIDFVPIFFPSPEEQRAIVNSIDMLARLKFSIDEFNEELSLNPKSAVSIQEQLIPMLDVINRLTDVDKVQALIRAGETKNIEFKQTLSLEVKNGTKQKYIEHETLKTIAAFLNTDGGHLLIGANDIGQITGIDNEIELFYKSNDKFKLHLKNLIKDKIGEEYYPFIDYEVLNVNDKKICLIECLASSRPCFINKNEFYIRTNPATDKLEGQILIDYVKLHFQNN